LARANSRLVVYAVAAIVLVFVTCSDDSTTPNQPSTPDAPSFVLAWGNYGTGDGEFGDIRGIASDADGNIYVVEAGYDISRIQKFNANGMFLTKWRSDRYGAIACDPGGNVYVGGYSNCIQVFPADGKWLVYWCQNGCDDGEFWVAYGIAFDADGNLHVTGREWCGDTRIQKFDANGTFLANIYGAAPGDTLIRTLGAIALNDNGEIYVVDGANMRIHRFDANGKHLTMWGSPGNGDGQLAGPSGIACDADGNVYVTDWGNQRVQKFDAGGTFLTEWGSEGTGDGQFRGGSIYGSQTDIACDASGNIYVVDRGNYRIQKFRL